MRIEEEMEEIARKIGTAIFVLLCQFYSIEFRWIIGRGSILAPNIGRALHSERLLFWAWCRPWWALPAPLIRKDVLVSCGSQSLRENFPSCQQSKDTHSQDIKGCCYCCAEFLHVNLTEQPERTKGPVLRIRKNGIRSSRDGFVRLGSNLVRTKDPVTS